MCSERTAKPDEGRKLYSELDRRLLNDFQQELPLTSRPFAAIAEAIGASEEDVIEGFKRLKEAGAVSRVGPVFRTNRVGASTLAAIAVPPERLEEVARIVNGYTEVNHNYEREHRFNLWFVATAPDEDHLERVLNEIEERACVPVMSLPMLDDYHIDLGFRLDWR